MKKFLAFSLTTLAVLCMGLVLLNCNGDGGGCETHADCPEGQLCNPVTGDCYICTPNCAGKCCDDDGCGSTCPDNCPTGYICDTDCTCIPDVECTTDQRCIELYGANYTCNLTTNECECTPDCSGKCCGDDGCGVDCQDNCTAPMTCNTTTCSCEGCTDDNQCGATECCQNSACVSMDCGALVCGEDPVCGYDCGTCPAGEVCNNGVCEPPVIGDCPAGQECTDMTQGNGYFGCIIPPNTIPPGNQTGCDPANSIWCDGNYTCFQVDPDTVCVENCGTCTAPLTCQQVFTGGPHGCLGANASVPPGAPNCDAGPCAGNATCYSVGGTSTACVDNCSVGYGCTTEGATRCLGTTVQTCTNSAWVDTTDCSTSSQVCLNGACTAPAALGDFCENLACAAGLDCVGTTASVHSFCTPECDCDNQTGCDAGWECLLSDGGTPPTCWCAMLCATAAECPDGGAGGFTCEALATDPDGNDILGCMVQ